MDRLCRPAGRAGERDLRDSLRPGGGRFSAGSGRSSPERGGGPPKVVEGHGRSRVTDKGQETSRVPLHHASHGPPPPKGRIGNVRFPPQSSHYENAPYRSEEQTSKPQ